MAAPFKFPIWHITFSILAQWVPSIYHKYLYQCFFSASVVPKVTSSHTEWVTDSPCVSKYKVFHCYCDCYYDQRDCDRHTVTLSAFVTVTASMTVTVTATMTSVTVAVVRPTVNMTAFVTVGLRAAWPWLVTVTVTANGLLPTVRVLCDCDRDCYCDCGLRPTAQSQ
jgi:hypothetical protein